MTFKRFLYLIGQGPRIIALLKQLWSVLVETNDERLLEYLGDVEALTVKLKEAKTHDKRAEIAAGFSELIRRL